MQHGRRVFALLQKGIPFYVERFILDGRELEAKAKAQSARQ